MGAIASQITSLTIVYSIVYWGGDQRKHQNSASLAFVRGNHRGPVNSPHKWPVTRKLFPLDDVIMTTIETKQEPSNSGFNHAYALRRWCLWTTYKEFDYDPHRLFWCVISARHNPQKCPVGNPGHKLRCVTYTVYPKTYAHGFVVLCFVVVMQSFIMNSHEVFIHVHQGCFADLSYRCLLVPLLVKWFNFVPSMEK